MPAETLTLHFPDFVRVAGETLQGQVDVNVPQAMEDKIETVVVKVRGYIVTKTTETEQEMGTEHKTQTHYKTQNVELVRIDQQIWDHFNVPANAEVVACPFQIPLPPNLPPSFEYSHFRHSVLISYSLEVVGRRHGVFHVNRRIWKIFSVVPPATALELNATAALRQGWQGPWKPLVNTKQMRHGVLFGEYSEAKIELVLPDLPAFPMGTAIPFGFHVWTHTKPVHQEELEHKHGKLFPAPPTSPAEINLRLHIQGHMRVHHAHEKIEQKLDLLGSLGDKAAIANVRTTTDEPEFTPSPDHKDKGSWKRGVHFEGTMAFPYSPTFSTATAEWNYLLRMKVDFAGIGNDMELEFPIALHSGAACPPPPPSAYQANVPYMYPLPVGPPPMINLPPSYWTGEHHNWEQE